MKGLVDTLAAIVFFVCFVVLMMVGTVLLGALLAEVGFTYFQAFGWPGVGAGIAMLLLLALVSHSLMPSGDDS